MHKIPRIRNREQESAYQKDYLQRPEVKERAKAYRKKWTENNRERQTAHEKRYWQIIKNDPVLHEELKKKRRDRRLRAEVLEKEKKTLSVRYEKNKEVIKKRISKWKKENKSIVNAYNQTRRSRKKNAEGFFGKNDIEYLLNQQKGLCNGCACDIYQSYTIDHVIPLVRGGSNWPNNLQLLCSPCNSIKGTRTMEEWRGTSQ